MDFKTLEEQYYFLKHDIRGDIETGHIDIPLITLEENQDIDWWEEKPLDVSGDLLYVLDEDSLLEGNSLSSIDIIPVSSTLLMSKRARNLIMHLVPAETQFLPAIIQPTNDDSRDWFVLNLWKISDFWDKSRSEYLEIDGEVFDDELGKIFLDGSRVYSIPEDRRLVIRLEALDYEYLLFHEKLVKLLLENQMKGSLFIPLKEYGTGVQWLKDKLEKINKYHPW